MYMICISLWGSGYFSNKKQKNSGSAFPKPPVFPGSNPYDLGSMMCTLDLQHTVGPLVRTQCLTFTSSQWLINHGLCMFRYLDMIYIILITHIHDAYNIYIILPNHTFQDPTISPNQFFCSIYSEPLISQTKSRPSPR